jgi:hypothetical protein
VAGKQDPFTSKALQRAKIMESIIAQIIGGAIGGGAGGKLLSGSNMGR